MHRLSCLHNYTLGQGFVKWGAGLSESHSWPHAQLAQDAYKVHVVILSNGTGNVGDQTYESLDIEIRRIDCGAEPDDHQAFRWHNHDALTVLT